MTVFAHDDSECARWAPGLQKELLLRSLQNFGWEWPSLAPQLRATQDLYFDAICRIALERYASGRVALLGDAAWGGTLGGQGSGLAIVGAYVLANELAASRDYAHAFERYEARMKSYAETCQRGSMRVGPFFAPRTRLGYHARNATYAALTSRPLAWILDRLVTQAAADMDLPDYPRTSAALESY